MRFGQLVVNISNWATETRDAMHCERGIASFHAGDCFAHGYEIPLICTPEELMGA